jgi:hypothetical protein
MPRAPLTFAVPFAVAAALLAGAACSGRTTEASSSSIQDATAPTPGDASSSQVPEAGDAGGGTVDLFDSSVPIFDSGLSLSPVDSSLPPWGYNLDAAAPDPFDASCGSLALSLDPDATPNTCEVSPADVACNAAADCTVFQVGHCCFSNLYGVNTASTARCPLPPCAPPSQPCGTTGYVTEDCSDVPSLSDVGVACIDHRCRTFAATAQ